MTINAFYELVLSSSVVGEFERYIDQTPEYQKIEQEYKGRIYQSCNIHRISSEDPVARHIQWVFKYFNEKYFNYELFDTYEIQLLKYEKSGHYDWHSDYGVSENPDGDRKLSLSVQLSDRWEYTGGAMRIRDWYNREYDMGLECGNAMVFDARVPHKVLPVTNGTRHAVVAWAHGPRLR